MYLYLLDQMMLFNTRNGTHEPGMLDSDTNLTKFLLTWYAFA
jgi:hypothetical protein